MNIFDEIREGIEQDKAAKQPRQHDDGGRLDVERYLSDHGRQVVKVKPHKGGTLYCLDVCVFDPNHSPNESGIFQAAGGMLSYQDFHDTDKGRTWAEARQIISGDASLAPWMVGGNGQQRTYHEPPRSTETPLEKNPIQLVTLEDVFCDKIEDAPIITGLHYEDESLVIHADGGAGKSLVSQDIAMHLGAHSPDIWNLFPIPKGRLSVFVQSENSRRALQARAQKKIVGKPELLCGIGNVFYCGYSGAVQIAGAMIDEKFRKHLIDYAKAVEDHAGAKIGNMVFDPLISFSDGDENDNALMRRTLDLITETSGKIGATPTVLHHSNKVNGLRGASAIQNWARSIIKLERIGAESDRRIMVTNTKNNNHEYFRPFALELDENLNFHHRKREEILSPKKTERCLSVADALRKMGGRAETQDALIEQYMEDSKLKSASTAQGHINLAETSGFILAEEYRDGKLIKKRYYLPEVLLRVLEENR
jgi:hypothetical protein